MLCCGEVVSSRKMDLIRRLSGYGGIGFIEPRERRSGRAPPAVEPEGGKRGVAGVEVGVAWAVRSGNAVRFGKALLIRRLCGCVRAGFRRPRAAARGYTRPLLCSSVRMAGRRRLAEIPTSTAASQLSPNPQHCWETGFFMWDFRHGPRPLPHDISPGRSRPSRQVGPKSR